MMETGDGKESLGPVDKKSDETLGSVRKSSRNITPTEKGKQYQRKSLRSFIETAQKRLDKQIKLIESVLIGTNTELVNSEMVGVEKTYADITDSYARFCGLFGEVDEEDEQEEHVAVSIIMEQVDSAYLMCKTDVCQWLLVQEKNNNVERSEKLSSVSKRSRASTRSRSTARSNASNLSAKSIREEAKIAGLKAEMEAVKRTKDAELTAELSRLEQKIKKAEAIKDVYTSHENPDCAKMADVLQDPSKLLEPSKEHSKAVTTLKPVETAQLQNAFMDMIKLQTAPKPDLDVFSGDPLEYLFFRANFREVVESSVTDQRGRLTRLIKYTSGEAQELIKHFVHAESHDCYDKAVRLLDKEYGNMHLLSCSYLKQLRQWEAISDDDPVGFKKLYRFLLKCQTFKQLDRLQELDSTDVLATIISKVHPSHQSRWNRRAVEIRRGGKEANFADLVKFFEKEAEMLNDPAYSRKALSHLVQHV